MFCAVYRERVYLTQLSWRLYNEISWLDTEAFNGSGSNFLSSGFLATNTVLTPQHYITHWKSVPPLSSTVHHIAR